MRKFLWVAAFCMYLMVPGSLLFAGESGEPFAVPVSDQVVYGVLELPDGYKADFVVREGLWVTIEDRGKKQFFGFQATLDDDGTPSFTPWRLARASESSGSSADQAGDTRLIPVGSRARFREAGGVLISAKGIGKWDFALRPFADPSKVSPLELQAVFGGSANGICCVSCGERTVCASSVTASCGRCEGGGGGGMVY